MFELQFFRDMLSDGSFERDYGKHQTKNTFSTGDQSVL